MVVVEDGSERGWGWCKVLNVLEQVGTKGEGGSKFWLFLENLIIECPRGWISCGCVDDRIAMKSNRFFSYDEYKMLLSLKIMAPLMQFELKTSLQIELNWGNKLKIKKRKKSFTIKRNKLVRTQIHLLTLTFTWSRL